MFSKEVLLRCTRRGRSVLPSALRGRCICLAPRAMSGIPSLTRKLISYPLHAYTYIAMRTLFLNYTLLLRELILFLKVHIYCLPLRSRFRSQGALIFEALIPSSPLCSRSNFLFEEPLKILFPSLRCPLPSRS